MNKTVDLLDKIGYDVSELRDKGRRLILNIPGENIEVVLAKAADVITYVEHGVCDIGVVGKDTIMEHGVSSLRSATSDSADASSRLPERRAAISTRDTGSRPSPQSTRKSPAHSSRIRAWTLIS